MIKEIGLDGGLVTSRHASLLGSGELTRADDSRYRADDPALWRAWGRTRYLNSNAQVGGASGKVSGLAYCPFEPTAEGTSDDFIVALKADKYYTSVFTTRTGSLSGTTIDSVGTGTHLDACHANNRWFLFNGNSDGIANRVLKPGTSIPVSRRHGLVPVSMTPTNPIVSTSAGSWPLDESFWGEGRFFFLTTEVVGPGTNDELESAALGTPPSVDLQKDGTGNISFDVTVKRHTVLANSTATEVRFYMVKASLNQAWDDSLLARAFRVGSVGVTGTPANDKIVLSSALAFYDPTLAATVATVSGTITNASFMALGDNNAASVASGDTAVVDMTNWGFAVPAGTNVLGMVMWIRYRAPGLGIGTIAATFRTGAGPTLGIAKGFSTGADDYVLHTQPGTGGSDPWGLSLVGSDVNSSNFGVRLTIRGIGCPINIDYVSIRVFTGNVPTIGPAYPIIAIQRGNVLVVQSANTPPPVSATGDIVDGALLVDNVNNRRELAYSLPSEFDYFPALYRIGIDSREHDLVMVVRRVGDVGLIFMRHEVYRVNYLPYSTDPEFVTGRCYEAIVPDHGCVSRQGVALFQYPGGPILAGYASHNGIYMNDGARDHIMTPDIKWDTMVDVTQLDKCVLVNYPKEYVLMFNFIAAGSGTSENNRYLLIHYHPSHRKENGHFKITGPNVMRVACAAVAKLGSERVLFTGHPTDARVYVEDNAVSDAEGTGINMLAETGEIYPGGRGKQVSIVRSWAHSNGAGTNMLATMTPYYRNTGAGLTAGDAESFVPGTEGLALLQTRLGLVEAVRYRLSLPDDGADNAAVAFNYLMHDYNEHAKSSNT